jgi:hypothetical protein
MGALLLHGKDSCGADALLPAAVAVAAMPD